MSIDDTVYTEDITVVTTERGADLRGEKVEEPSTGETGDEAEDKPPFRMKFVALWQFLLPTQRFLTLSPRHGKRFEGIEDKKNKIMPICSFDSTRTIIPMCSSNSKQ